MAEFSKYGATSIGRLFLHNNRMSDDGVKHSNETIDNDKTVYNYHIKKGSVKLVQERLENVFSQRRSNATILGEMIVTLPKDVKEADERDFFQAVYDFYAADFGEENIVNAVVHKDETTPHIHLDFIPTVPINAPPKSGKNLYDQWVIKHGKKPTEKLCCKEKISRTYLSNMHNRLSDYVMDYLGYEVSIINGATVNGNRTVLQLKADSMNKELTDLKKQKKHLESEINAILTVAKNNGLEASDMGLYPLMQKIEDLSNQNSVLRRIITRQGYSWKKEDIEQIQEKKYVPAKSVSVNVYDGTLADADIEDNAVVVIELPDEENRSYRQNEFIEKEPDLERQTKMVRMQSKKVTTRTSMVNDRTYVFVKADNVRQTLDGILMLEKQLKEIDLRGRKVYMDRMEFDYYDLARSVLQKNNIEALYFTGRREEQKIKVGMRGEDKEIYK